MAIDIEEVAVRSGTSSDWAAATGLVLEAGELGVNLTTGDIRIGDGTTAFGSLPRRDGVKARGVATLAAGTVNVTGLTGVATGDIVIATPRALGTVTASSAVRAVAGTNQITITSEANNDTSTVQYVVFAQ